ncbi:hypothetical protein LGK95_17730 [Clostridium algoriphilum]|uniref:hypothetical protein n=1 Tax=Clostridium algoriphilum TaxID=198347 RepID=UPI001CF128CD|nr:hypothetical protein [Clostridium algoriphilum]MCB2295327.1 hypothetical protein [Clostridium algoriphilum]
MSEQLVQQNVKSNFFKKFFFNFKVNRALKDCNDIESYLLRNKYLSKSDSRLNLIISDGFNNDVDDNYFLYKGYTANGSITPLKKYTFIDGEIEKYTDVVSRDIIIVDLYEKSTYLHSYSKNSRHITGYLIKEEIKSDTTKTLIFSNEMVKINIKNINKFDTISIVDDFINKFIM